MNEPDAPPKTDAECIASLLQDCDSLRRMLAAANELLAVRDLQLTALRQALHEATSLRDATDPGPTLVAETRAAFPANALRGGDGRPTW